MVGYSAGFLVGLPFCLRLVGWLPENGTLALLVAFFGIWVIGYIPFQSVSIVIDSCLSDIADEHELATGHRAEGLIFAMRTFGAKMTQGFGGLLFMIGPLYWIIVGGGLGLAFLYNIDRSRHAEILRGLEARRGDVAAASR